MSRIWHWEKRGFLLIGTDLYDGLWGITFGYGFRPNVPEGETAWRQVWRIRICWPIKIRHRFSIPRS